MLNDVWKRFNNDKDLTPVDPMIVARSFTASNPDRNPSNNVDERHLKARTNPASNVMMITTPQTQAR
jgi:hypothetical protein